jgi:hypothetical protein
MFLCKENVKVLHEIRRTVRVCYSRISTSLSLSRKRQAEGSARDWLLRSGGRAGIH